MICYVASAGGVVGCDAANAQRDSKDSGVEPHCGSAAGRDIIPPCNITTKLRGATDEPK